MHNPDHPSAPRRLRNRLLAIVLFSLAALLLGGIAFGQSTPPPAAAIRFDGFHAEPRVHLRASPPELHPPDLRGDSHEARLASLGEVAGAESGPAADGFGRNILLAALIGLALCASLYGLIAWRHPDGRAGFSVSLLAACLLLSGCAGLRVSGTVPLGDGGKAVIGIDGKQVTLDLRGQFATSTGR